MIQTVKIVDLGDIQNASLSNKEFKQEVANFYEHNPHNNGWSTFFPVQAEDQCEYYPLINKFLIEVGAEVGDSILLRSSW